MSDSTSVVMAAAEIAKAINWCKICGEAFPTPEELKGHICKAIHKRHYKEDALLMKREETHGSFAENALISQNIKQCLYACHGWEKLNWAQREALEMIALKLSRILSGQTNFRDHWDDIAGYAKLASEACNAK